LSSDLSEPSHYVNSDLVVLNCSSTSNEQGVDLPAHLPKRLMRRDSQATVRNKRPPRRRGYDFDGIDWIAPGILRAEHFRGASKDLKWPDQIQDLGPRPRNEHHSPRSRLNLLLIV
jgi:hypothetical protein